MAVTIAKNEFDLNPDNVLAYFDDELYGYLPTNRIIETAQNEFKNKFTQITISKTTIVSLEVKTDDIWRFSHFDFSSSQTQKELLRYACKFRSDGTLFPLTAA